MVSQQTRHESRPGSSVIGIRATAVAEVARAREKGVQDNAAPYKLATMFVATEVSMHLSREADGCSALFF